ncbi:MAG: tripartite tricarboxylate transporter TctB family protein [Desulfobacteraceae bacterium]|nr:MAG: tripartite tricarboxylate transporter TctB family protein [Desulfobacteraceae bacterium]
MTRKRDLVSSLLWFVVAAVFCTGAVRHGVFERGAPGPGFFPFLAGLMLILPASLLFIFRMAEKKGKGEQESPLPFFPEKSSWKRLVHVAGCLVFYSIALEYLGFLVTTFLFMIFLLRIEPRGWTATLATGILATLSSYTLFEILLKVQLPRWSIRLWGGF